MDCSNFSSYDGLIFDMDGTVIDTMPCHRKAWDRVGEAMGYSLNGDIMYKLGGATVRTIALEMMKECSMPLELLDQVLRLKENWV